MKLYKIKEVAELLRLTYETVRTMIADGQLLAVRIRGTWRIRQDHLDKFMEDNLHGIGRTNKTTNSND